MDFIMNRQTTKTGSGYGLIRQKILINEITPESYFSVFTDRNMINIIKNTTIDVSGEIVIYNMLGQPVCRGKSEK